MSQPIRLFALLIACTILPMGASTAGTRMQPHALLAVEVERYNAMIAADRSALAPMLAEELVYIHSNGIQENKVQLLDAIQAGDIKYLSIVPSETKIRDHGRWAALTGLIDMTVYTSGKKQSATLLYTAIYERVDRRWQLVSWQTTRARG